jgi:HEPN domain-containing protein
MNPLTLEWVQKAEGDWATAGREYRARKSPNYDAGAFHAQQCAEKYLKARLQEAGVSVQRTHDLVTILEALPPVPLAFGALRKGLIYLTRAAVEVRYPGSMRVTKSDLKELIAVARAVREHARAELGLPKLR